MKLVIDRKRFKAIINQGKARDWISPRSLRLQLLLLLLVVVAVVASGGCRPNRKDPLMT
jgi:hypothetical protein